METKLMRLSEVEAIVGMKKTKIYRQIKKEKFPRPRQNEGQSLWLSSDVENWILSLKVKAENTK